MKNKILISLIAFLGLFSSCNFLDVVPDNVATIEYAFLNRTSAQKYLYTCYYHKPTIGDIHYDVAMTGGDENWVHSFLTWTPLSFAKGQQNTTDPLMNFWDNRKGANRNLWQGIRDCNIFIENIDGVEDMQSYEKNKWKAEVKFLKAYYHYYLFLMYGPIPITDVNLPVNATVDQVKVYRDPVDDVVKYIVDLMDEAAADLPLPSEVIEAEEAGRINKLIAVSMKAHVLTTAASPLFNGNTNYASVKDNRGVQLFPQTYDPNKWVVAAEALKKAIDFAHEQGKALYDIVDPLAQNAPEAFHIQTTYREAICSRWNKELIWGETNHQYNLLNEESMARVLTTPVSNRSCKTDWAPTMKVVEFYYSKNGVPISEDKEWSANGWYDKRYELRPEPSSGDEKYLVEEGQETAYMHFNRETRFYASIGFDRGIYFGNGYYDFGKNVKHLKFKNAEYSGLASVSEYLSITGFSAKKMHSFKNAATADRTTVEYFPFPILRLADLYLLYAEALNESQGPVAEVYEYLDKVRARVGLEGVVDSWNKYSNDPSKPSTKNGLREIIHRERHIELAFEGKRFWDVRRWKKISELNEQPRGWNVIGKTNEDFYKVVYVSNVVVKFSTKNYLWPIMEEDMVENRNLVQNYGW